MATPVALITGCSSGIGRALSQTFHDRGYRVVATARRPDSLADLNAQGMLTLPLDVTDSRAVDCASKAASHALSDALRLELKPFGIDVVTVQPGAITSNFGQAGEASLSGWDTTRSWYGLLESQIKARASLSQADGMSAQEFADHIVNRVTQASPPPRIRLGPKSWWLPSLRLCLPTRLFEYLLARKFGLRSLLANGSHNR
jgi:NAD(P)-dependent dehydrogenase (short-subunit alcohol dehydrogenase family)